MITVTCGDPPVPSEALECDVCIVGAGPAGLTIASELAGRGINVVLLESGGTASEPAIQELNRGAVVGDAYAGLQATRNRALGGTAHLWNTAFDAHTGAKYVPLDPWDFAPRDTDALPGWPLDYATLERYYPSAQAHCGLGSYSYDASGWEDGDRRGWSFPQASLLCSGLYHFGYAQLFTAGYVTALRASRNAHVREHATVVQLVAGAADRVAHVEARDTASGEPFTVAATTFVLAAGTIENARLLLVSQLSRLIAGSAWVGRCFMEHPRDWSLRLVPVSRAAIHDYCFYDTQTNTSGATVCGRLALAAGAAASLHPPNFSVTLLPDVPAPTGITRYLQRMGVARDRRGYGWSQHLGAGAFFDRFRLVINFEQRPRPENYVTLAHESDALGMPRPELHWRWTAPEQAEWERTRSAIAAAIEGAGMGRIVALAANGPDPNAHHHSGTTRMGNDAAWSVVDRDCRVHGTSNLYVTGASVFPTAGYANPMLTIVALAIRLAEHLQPSAAVRHPSP
jgi:choline dehydrogenase-like flavoprotein